MVVSFVADDVFFAALRLGVCISHMEKLGVIHVLRSLPVSEIYCEPLCCCHTDQSEPHVPPQM